MNSLGIVRLKDKSKFIVISENIYFHVAIDKSIILLVFYFYDKVYRLQRKWYAQNVGLSHPRLAEYSMSSFLLTNRRLTWERFLHSIYAFGRCGPPIMYIFYYLKKGLRSEGTYMRIKKAIVYTIN